MSTTAIDPQPLIDQAKCFWCAGNPGLAPYMVLAALIDVAEGNTVPTDPDELIDEARCLFSCVSPGMVPYVTIAAIQNISLGGGSPNRVFRGSYGDPNGNVTAPAAALYYDTDGSVWIHQSSGTNDTGWIEIIAA